MLRLVVMMSAPRFLCCLLAAVAAACAQPERPAPRTRYDSLVPGTIGIAVTAGAAGVVISAMAQKSTAAAAGARVGDVVLRYDGVSVVEPRQFYRLMLDSAPGSAIELELQRDGAAHRIVVPVRQIDTASRA